MISASRGRRPLEARRPTPRQARSTETYRRLLAAAESLLQTKSFDAVTVAEIAGRAGVTIGAFYARFADKEALLEALEALVTETVLGRLAAVADTASLDGLTLEAALRRYFDALVGAYRATRGAGRALVLRSHTDGKLRGRLERLNSDGPPRVIGSIVAGGAIRHPEPRQGLELALLMIRSTLRETILFHESRLGGPAVPPSVLVEELTRFFLAYLGLDGRKRLHFPHRSARR